MDVTPSTAVVEARVQKDSVIRVQPQEAVIEVCVEVLAPKIDLRGCVGAQIVRNLPRIVDRLQWEDGRLDMIGGVLGKEASPFVIRVCFDAILVNSVPSRHPLESPDHLGVISKKKSCVLDLVET